MSFEMSPAYEVGVLTFEGHESAERLVSSFRRAGFVRQGTEVAILEHTPGGRFSVHSYESEPTVGSHVLGGAVVGGLLTSFLLGPFGLLAGLIGGGLVGASMGGSHPHDLGMSAEFTSKLKASLPKNSSAVVIVGEPDEMQELMGHVRSADVVTKVELHEALSQAQTQAIRQALDEARSSVS